MLFSSDETEAIIGGCGEIHFGFNALNSVATSSTNVGDDNSNELVILVFFSKNKNNEIEYLTIRTERRLVYCTVIIFFYQTFSSRLFELLVN